MLSDKDLTLLCLDLFKTLRLMLAKDFLEKEPNLLTPMFKYEQHPSQMQLSLDSYFIGWIDNHWNMMETIIDRFDHSDQEQVRDLFSKVFLSFSSKYSIDNPDSIRSGLFHSVLKKKIKTIESLQSIGDNSNRKYKILELEYEKNRSLFKRKLESLK